MASAVLIFNLDGKDEYQTKLLTDRVFFFFFCDFGILEPFREEIKKKIRLKFDEEKKIFQTEIYLMTLLTHLNFVCNHYVIISTYNSIQILFWNSYFKVACKLY